MFVPCPGADSIEQCPPMSARRWHILLRPLPDAVAGDSDFTVAIVVEIDSHNINGYDAP